MCLPCSATIHKTFTKHFVLTGFPLVASVPFLLAACVFASGGARRPHHVQFYGAQWLGGGGSDRLWAGVVTAARGGQGAWFKRADGLPESKGIQRPIRLSFSNKFLEQVGSSWPVAMAHQLTFPRTVHLFSATALCVLLRRWTCTC